MQGRILKTRITLLCAFVVLLMTVAALPAAAMFGVKAQRDPYVGDVAMSDKKTLLDNLSASPIHTEFVKALHTTGVDQTLSNGGPYTVFAPTDDAFRRPQRAGGAIVLSGDALASAVKYHIVQGRLSAKQLRKRIKKGHGTATLQTLAGRPLTVNKYGSVLVLTDAKGGTSTLITEDVLSKSSTFHVIDAVLMPQ